MILSLKFTRFWEGLGPILIETTKFVDKRGFFSESWNKKSLQKIGISSDFVQDNFSYSKHKFTL